MLDALFAFVEFLWFLIVAYTVGHYWGDFGNRHADPDIGA